MLTRNQQTIAACLGHFLDRAYYPDFHPTEADWQTFFRVETRGKAGITAAVLERIAPLLEAKGDYELQIKMVYSETAEWWSEGNGWIYPIEAAIRSASETPEMAPYLAALEKIRSAFARDAITAVANYTGFSQEERNKYLKRYEQGCATLLEYVRSRTKTKAAA